jgi:hypothetical protein
LKEGASANLTITPGKLGEFAKKARLGIFARRRSSILVVSKMNNGHPASESIGGAIFSIVPSQTRQGRATERPNRWSAE